MTRLVMPFLALFLAGQTQETRQIRRAECAAAPTTRVWSTTTPAVVKTRVEPSWPHPRLNDTRGVLVLDVWIDERGQVVCLEVLQSIPLNDQAAIDAVRQWTFTPATAGGRPIAVIQQVRVQKQ
jgi:TonB family protein